MLDSAISTPTRVLVFCFCVSFVQHGGKGSYWAFLDGGGGGVPMTLACKRVGYSVYMVVAMWRVEMIMAVKVMKGTPLGKGMPPGYMFGLKG